MNVCSDWAKREAWVDRPIGCLLKIFHWVQTLGRQVSGEKKQWNEKRGSLACVPEFALCPLWYALCNIFHSLLSKGPTVMIIAALLSSWNGKVYFSFVIQFCWTKYALILSQMASSALTKVRQKGVSRTHYSYIEGAIEDLFNRRMKMWHIHIRCSIWDIPFYHADEVSVAQSHTP